jgi:hypothetical protein
VTATFDSTLVARMTFVLHALHHLHETSASIWNIHVLVDNFFELKLQSMQEGQLFSKFLLLKDSAGFHLGHIFSKR